MKYVVLIPDGAADLPRAELSYRTPLQAAAIPNLDRLAASGNLGLVRTIPPGIPPGSDVANLCVLGYDPHKYYSGRAPLEAASLGIELAEDDVAFRCNLVNIKDGKMNDFSAGHIGTGDAGRLIASLGEELGGGDVSFHTGLSYRHIMVARGRGGNVTCAPPHDISGKPIDDFLPKGEDASFLRELMEASVRLLSSHPVNIDRAARGELTANMIWLWGQGTAPAMPSFSERFGLTGAVITAVDLVKGLGLYAGLDIIEVPGATGYLDTNFAGKASYALEALGERDFAYIHVEAPDEASHSGDTEAKIKAIEQIDAELLGPLLEGLEGLGDSRLLVLPDHATPLEIKTHTDKPVPYLIHDSRSPGDGRGAFDEEQAAASGVLVENGWELMGRFLTET